MTIYNFFPNQVLTRYIHLDLFSLDRVFFLFWQERAHILAGTHAYFGGNVLVWAGTCGCFGESDTPRRKMAKTIVGDNHNAI
ncbi:MAG: hypothetical protein GY874_16615 [Desulfobacteraceae bacterium]|nr:hypothetical protein [Desulfobacteraceae bacterium]